MRCSSLLAIMLALFAAVPAFSQNPKQEREDEFIASKPVVGDSLPELIVYSPDGTEFKTTDLRGHFTVLTFGCLT